jgi:hypothetical protein
VHKREKASLGIKPHKILIKMVTIIGIEERLSKTGNFGVIVLQGKVEVAISKETGRPYLTARKTSIPFTFDEEFAETLIGTQLPGDIERIDCEEYEFLVPGTKKKLKLSHTFQYSATPMVLEEVIG